MKFAVCVSFNIKPEFSSQFMSLVTSNAKQSLAVEDDCLIFHVCANEEQPSEVFLYEIYTSSEAFQAHLKTAHFLQFDLKITDMIIDKTVKTYATVI